jgi:hypothetical protein
VPAVSTRPYIPALRHYTAPQRRAAQRIETPDIRRVARVSGLKPYRAAELTYADRGARNRRAIASLGRSERHHLEVQARRQGFESYGQQLAMRTAQQLKPGRAGRFSDAAGHFAVAGLSTADLGSFLKHRTLIGAAHPAKIFKAFATPIAHDAISLPANVVTGLYYSGHAGVKAAEGHPEEAKRLWKSFKQTDPVALAVQGKFRKALIAAGQHPVAASLEVTGVGGTVSRLAGRAERLGTGTAAAARATRRLPGTQLGEVRRYSPGVIGRGAQVARERRGIAKAARLTERARAAEAKGPAGFDRARTLRQRAGAVDPQRLPERYIEHRVDVREGLAQSVRRPHRMETAQAVRKVLPKHGDHAVSLVAQGIVRASKDDLQAFKRELETEYPKIEGRARRSANRKLRRQIDHVIRDPKVDMGAVERAAHDYAAVSRPIEDKLVSEGMLSPKEAEKARLIPYAVRHMGARREGERIVSDIRIPGAGEKVTMPLATEQIRAHMQARGINPDQVAFVTHSPEGLGDRAFNVSFRRPRGIPQRARSGEAVRQGLIDAHPERLVEQGVKARGLVDAADQFRGFIKEMGLRDKGGKLHTFQNRGEAEAHAKELMYDQRGEPLPGAYAWRAVRVNPWRGREAQLQKLIDHGDEAGFASDVRGTVRHPLSEAVHDALTGKGGDQGEWAVVPEVAAKRLEDHASVYQSQGHVMRTVTQAFRRTVLPTSPSWLTGNTVEAALRSAVVKAGPTSWLRFRRVYNELAQQDPKVAEEMLHRIPGGHYGGTERTTVHITSKQFEDTRLAPLARAMHELYRRPGPGTLARGFRHFTDWVFNSVNARVEGQFARAMAGRYFRDHLMDTRARGTMETAVQQAARGLRDTNEQSAMADFVRKAYGQYDSFSPAMRKVILNYTPFAAWSLNATKFLFSVLPRDHPTLTGLAAANHQLTEDWRKQHGLDPYAQNAVPDFLQGSIPLPGGRHLRVARFTPFGFFTTPTDTVASNVLPQFSGALMALRGLDWKGQPLGGPHGKKPSEDQKAAIAAREFAFSTVPIIGQVARGIQKGSPLPVLNPLTPVAKRKQRGRKSGIDSAIDRALGGRGGSGGRSGSGSIDKQIDKALGGR